jgi:uncharacterized membrane protein
VSNQGFLSFFRFFPFGKPPGLKPIDIYSINVFSPFVQWGAMGTMLVTAAGILFFGETLDFTKIVCLIMITAGVFGLNMR